jgi:hypothetical protein
MFLNMIALPFVPVTSRRRPAFFFVIWAIDALRQVAWSPAGGAGVVRPPEWYFPFQGGGKYKFGHQMATAIA